MTEIAAGTLVVVLLVLVLSAGLLAARRRLVPQEALTVTVNDGRQIPAARGDVLLEVLHAAGIGIPAACGGRGTCGLCRVTATGEGAGAANASEAGILSAAERRARVRLACQVTLRGPVSVEVPTEALEAERLSCPVVSNRMLAPLIRELVLQWPEGHAFRFRAGGFVQLAAPPYSITLGATEPPEPPEPFRDAWRIAGWSELRAASTQTVSRAYSVASRPEDAAAGRVVFNIRLAVPPAGREAEIPPGIVSSYLFSLRPGDRVGAAGPFGAFHVQDSDRDMVFIGGGVGMAPLRAMVHEQIAQATARKIAFFYGARTRADLLYVDEFEALAARHPNLSWTPALSDPAPGDRWTGAKGFIHDAVRERLLAHPAPEDCEYYLCGPPMMISAVLRTLDRLGVERGSIFNDDFGV